MAFIVIGIVTAFNMLVIKTKLERKRYEDAIFDLGLMALLAFMFSGSFGGMVVAMIASLCISLFFLASPPKFVGGGMSKLKKHIDEINELNKL